MYRRVKLCVSTLQADNIFFSQPVNAYSKHIERVRSDRKMRATAKQQKLKPHLFAKLITTR